MRKQWFGDSRDYVKWSCIVTEASDRLFVVYGPMLRPDCLAGVRLEIKVRQFFDNLKDFGSLSPLFPMGFEYLRDTYEIERATAYFDALAVLITRHQETKRVLVFLDPDTGIEPARSKPKHEHLYRRDLVRMLALLREGEKLVVYQHAPRERDWQKTWLDSLKPLARETDTELSEPYCEVETAKDVCFFVFTKRGGGV